MKNTFTNTLLTGALLFALSNALAARNNSSICSDNNRYELRVDSLTPCSVDIEFPVGQSGPTFTLNALPQGTTPFVYKWTAFNNVAMGYDRSSSLEIQNKDEYCVIIKDSTGCVAADCYLFNPDSLYCQAWISRGYLSYNNTDEVILSIITYSDSIVSVLWNTGATTQEIITTQPGTYSATIVNDLGCTYTAEYELEACNNLTVWVDMQDSLEGIAAKVYLYNVASNPPLLVDSVLTDLTTGMALFENVPSGTYTVAASLLPSSSVFAEYEPLTFARIAPGWELAETVSVRRFCESSSNLPVLNIWLRRKSEFLSANLGFPNPVSDVFFIDLAFQAFSFKLTNISGHLLREENVPTQQFAYQLDMKPYGKGIYFLHVRIGENVQVVKLLKI